MSMDTSFSVDTLATVIPFGVTAAGCYELRSQSAARSPIMMVVALVLALITFGIT